MLNLLTNEINEAEQEISKLTKIIQKQSFEIELALQFKSTEFKTFK